MKKKPFKTGDIVKCIRAVRNERSLVSGKNYTVLKDEEPGIFINEPYVTINGEEGPVICHASRFKPIK